MLKPTVTHGFSCIGLAFIADPPSIWAGAAITILSAKSKCTRRKQRQQNSAALSQPRIGSFFPKVEFGIIALLILRQSVESTTVGFDSINGWEADEPCGDGLQRKAFSYVRMSAAAELQGDSLRPQSQLSGQYIGVSAFDGSNIAHYLPCVGGWTADAVVALSVATACVLPPSAQIAQISFSSPARSVAPD